MSTTTTAPAETWTAERIYTPRAPHSEMPPQVSPNRIRKNYNFFTTEFIEAFENEKEWTPKVNPRDFLPPTPTDFLRLASGAIPCAHCDGSGTAWVPRHGVATGLDVLTPPTRAPASPLGTSGSTGRRPRRYHPASPRRLSTLLPQVPTRSFRWFASKQSSI
jgi:hypothetical protein